MPRRPARLIAFGDIHGCDAALATVLEAITPAPDDQLVFLGDYIDRGPESCQVIDRLIDLQQRFDVVTILGNHEEMLLQAIAGKFPVGMWMRYGGAETLDSYGCAGNLSGLPDKHIEFFNACVDSHVTKDFFFTHANYIADELFKSQPAEALRWQHLAPGESRPHVSGRTVIVGHTAQKSGEVLDLGHLRCLDTYCHGGGWLTAMDVLTGEAWQADRTGQLRYSSF